jgi:predicted kinase
MSGVRPDTSEAVFVITGAMASGKSTVAQLLAERFDRAVHVRGDVRCCVLSVFGCSLVCSD